MISIAYDVNIYREILGYRVRRNDIVIELGPHTGKSTLVYLPRTKLTIVVDKSNESKEHFSNILKNSENIRFVLGDVRSFETIINVLKISRECDVLAVDMGGGRYPDTVFKVWAIWSGIFKPRDSIIRNRGLAEFIQRAKIEDNSIIRNFEDSGWLSEYGRGIPYKLRKQLEEFKFWVEI
ncbi:MAG: SAM-dependent methyltransferase [Candidatus Altiarchaeales archaeon]|nr:MAG: SAM-dependent methyltransferase [Candidatus Altiarchaeales archaeon]